MDTRELLNKAITETIKQGKPSRAGKNCLYRGPNGTKCAIGHIIADQYIDLVQGDGWSETIDSDKGIAALQKSIKRKVGSKEIRFFYELQACHDGAPPDKFIKAFKENIYYAAKEGRLPEYCMEIIEEVQP